MHCLVQYHDTLYFLRLSGLTESASTYYILTAMIREPTRAQVEWWTNVEDVRVGALSEVRDAQLGPGNQHKQRRRRKRSKGISGYGRRLKLT